MNKIRERHCGRRFLLPGELEQVGPGEWGECLPRNKAAMPFQGRGRTEGRAGAGQQGPHAGRVGWEERPVDEPKDGMETGTGASGLGSQARPGRGLEEQTLLLLGWRSRGNRYRPKQIHGRASRPAWWVIWEVKKARPKIATSPGSENRHRATEGLEHCSARPFSLEGVWLVLLP